MNSRRQLLSAWWLLSRAGGYVALTCFPVHSSVLTVEYKINLIAPASVDHDEAEGVAIKSAAF